MFNGETPKIKWCFIAIHVPPMREFYGKLAHQVVKEGDDCLVMADSKIKEYATGEYFPKNTKVLSKVDWCIKNYKKDREDFGGLSWKEFFSDFERFKLFKNGFDKSVEAVSQIYQFVDFVLRKERPNLVIYEPPSGTFSEIACYLCKKYQIPYYGFISSKIDGRIAIYDSEHTFSKYEEDFKKITSISESEKRFAKDLIQKFISHKQLPSYMKYQRLFPPVTASFKNYFRNSIKTLPFWLRYISKRNRFKKFDSISEMQLRRRLSYPFRIVKIRMKRLFQESIFSSPKENDKFFLFPFHIQPEASTLVRATYFYDQVNTIKNIAFSLPLPYKLYVKEHPAVRGDRPKDFYKKLKEIPNLVLISPFENVENLIKKSQGVITLTSTVGMEAALAGKPVYVLGNTFYSYHPLCQKISGFEELKQRIQMDLFREPAISNLEDINPRFILSYFKNTIVGDIAVASSENDTNDYQAIYKEIKRIFSYEI